MLIEEDGVVVGSGSFGKFEIIKGIPVADRKEEFLKYVKTEKGSSEAAQEMIHFAAFKTRVDKAWAYIHGARTYEVDDAPGKRNPINITTIVVAVMALVGLAIVILTRN
jgi:hypothetical protein